MRDAALVVAQYQDFTNAIVSNVLSNGSIDLGAVGTAPTAFQAIGNITADYGRGKPIFSECRVTTAFTSGTSAATVKAQVVNADDAALATNLIVVDETDAIIVTSLVAGYRFKLGSLPANIGKRYLGMRFVIAVETVTAGQVWGEFTVAKIDKPVSSTN